MATRKDDKDPAERPTGMNLGQDEQASPQAMGGEYSRPSHRGDSERNPADRAMQQATELGRRGSEQMRSFVGLSAKTYRDLTDYSHGDADTFMQSGARLARGIQDVGWEVMQFTQNSLRMSMQCANDMMTCHSVEDIVQLQNSFIKSSVDTILQEGARLLEMSGNITTEAVSPITERIQQSQGEGAVRH